MSVQLPRAESDNLSADTRTADTIATPLIFGDLRAGSRSSAATPSCSTMPWVYWVRGMFLIPVEAPIVRFLFGPKLRPHDLKTPGLRSSSGRFSWSEVVVRGGVEPPTFRFSGLRTTVHQGP